VKLKFSLETNQTEEITILSKYKICIYFYFKKIKENRHILTINICISWHSAETTKQSILQNTIYVKCQHERTGPSLLLHLKGIPAFHLWNFIKCGFCSTRLLGAERRQKSNKLEFHINREEGILVQQLLNLRQLNPTQHYNKSKHPEHSNYSPNISKALLIA
jgi:hypothetical protein